MTLVSGKTNLEPPYGVEFVPVKSAEDMFEAVTTRAEQQDIIIKAAAVADYLSLIHILVILYISAVIPFTVLILRNFVAEIPVELEEAAAIDGATFVQRIITVIMPLMKPAIATVCIINFVSCLNNFFTPLFFANNIQVLSTAIVQLPLRDNMYSVPWDLVSAMAVSYTHLDQTQ